MPINRSNHQHEDKFGWNVSDPQFGVDGGIKTLNQRLKIIAYCQVKEGTQWKQNQSWNWVMESFWGWKSLGFWPREDSFSRKIKLRDNWKDTKIWVWGKLFFNFSRNMVSLKRYVSLKTQLENPEVTALLNLTTRKILSTLLNKQTTEKLMERESLSITKKVIFL